MSPQLPAIAQRKVMGGLRRLVFNPSYSFEKQRARLAAALAASKTPLHASLHEEVLSTVRCNVVTPDNALAGRTLVYVHGGGYCVGAPSMGFALISALANELRATAYCVDYRLAPEFAAPAAVTDVKSVLATLRGDVVVVGDSAGAGALVAALQKTRKKMKAAVLLSPWLDLTVDRRADTALAKRDPLLTPEWLEACASAYAKDLTDPQVSPLLGELQMPPTLIVGGSDDVLAPDAARLEARLQSQGVPCLNEEVPGLWHDFALSVGALPAADTALVTIVAFCRSRTGW